MLDFWLFFKLGLGHVLDWNAYDHILFLVALTAAYTFVSWRRLLLLVSLFTLGHSLSLILASYNVLSVSSRAIEFLIPLTILIAAIFNLFKAGKQSDSEKIGAVYLITFFFGLIHGFGFASYYKMINPDAGIAPLLEFALGVEASQVIIVFMVLLIAFVFQSIIHIGKRDWVLVVSSIVIGCVIPMLVASWIF